VDKPDVKLVEAVKEWRIAHDHLLAKFSVAHAGPVNNIAVSYLYNVAQPVSGHVGKEDTSLGIVGKEHSGSMTCFLTAKYTAIVAVPLFPFAEIDIEAVALANHNVCQSIAG
jgi:hypothetical protein